ncbi:MAG: c-type cytochrome biogenesis protein CcsB [Actinobacteria bacterium]|nr:c-type cytochrome biogenesis protein CcsB [Actinomycetota bacterium]
MVDPGLARLSDTLFWVALCVYAGAMMLYFAALAYRGKRVGSIATLVAWSGWLAHAASVATRGIAEGRVPWGNMFEYSNMVGLLLVLVYLLVFERRLGLRQVGGFALGFGVIALASARFLYAPAGPLVPALQSYWLRIHVIAAISASSLFIVSFIFTVLYLVKARVERRAGVSTVGAAHVDTFEAGMPADLDSEEPLVRAKQRSFTSRLPSAQTLDQLSYRTIQFAFPVWTFAVICGAIWAHEAWGRYWGWDPKETWAFITWVIYAGYLHARSTAGWRGTRAAIISCVGFASVMFTYYAVNLWIAGLHSYAGVK